MLRDPPFRTVQENITHFTLRTQQCYKGYKYIISDLNFLKKLHVSCDYFFINNAFLSTNMIPLYNSNVIKPGNKILKRFKINTMEDEILICLFIQQIKLKNN